MILHLVVQFPGQECACILGKHLGKLVFVVYFVDNWLCNLPSVYLHIKGLGKKVIAVKRIIYYVLAIPHAARGLKRDIILNFTGSCILRCNLQLESEI